MERIIVTSTPAFGAIERPISRTPSESSTYFDIDEDEVDSLPNSETSKTSISTEAADPLGQQIVLPTTPTRPALYLVGPFEDLEISSISSPEGTSDSCYSSLTKSELCSPITERSRSCSISSNYLLEILPIIPTQDPCLQCFLASLSCSLSAQRSKWDSKTCCRRCARNGECFCIFQVAVEKNSGDRKNREVSGDNDYTYYSKGVEEEVVQEKAEELLKNKRVQTSFALPEMTVWKRQILRPVFGGWVVNDHCEVEVDNQEVLLEI